MKKKKVLLIGGGGFIGHNLALSLKERFEVSVIDSLQVNHLGEHTLNNNLLYINFLNTRLNLLEKNGIISHIIDARDYQLLTFRLKKIKPDIVIHLAAVAHAQKANKDPYSTIDHCMRTLENVLDIIRSSDTHFIFFSSSMVYGDFTQKKVKEDFNCNPKGIYGALKFGGEKLVIAYNQVFNNKYTIIRPSALYGPRCVSRRVIQIFIENAINNKNIVIDGDGEESLDFTYIDDLISGVEAVLNSDKSFGQIFNITFGRARKIKDLAEMIIKFFPNIELEYKERDKLLPLRGTLSIKKAKNLLNYSPKVSLEDGVEKYIKFYKNLNF